MSDSSTSLPPGFRFHPTDEELILHYLSNRAASLPCPVSVIADVDIYKFDPWDLPALAKSGDREWYFFTPRDRKYPNGVRPNRAAGSGYWKATGTDKPIAGKGTRIGVKKALVFYMGRPPKGIKTDWIMHEYRLDRGHARHDKKSIGLRDSSMRLDDWVLCRIYKKSTSHQRSMMNRENTPNGEDAYLSSSPNTGELDCPKLPRPSSLTELFDSVDYSILSQLFDIPNELPGSEPQCHFSSNQLPFIGTSNRSNGDSCSIGMLSEMDSPVSVCGMRPRMGEDCSEEGAGSIQSQKKQRNSGIWSNPTNNFGSLQNSSLLNQAFINQQFLNSSLGLL